MRKILVNLESINIATRVIPVVKELERHGGYDPIVFTSLRATGTNPNSQKAFAGLLNDSKMKVITPESVGLTKFEPQLNAMIEDYKKDYLDAINASPEVLAINYRGVPLMKYVAGMILQDNMVKAKFMSWAEKVIAAVKPALVLTGYDFGGPRRYFVMAANGMGVPTMTLQYGTWKFLRSSRVAKHLCLWGQKTYDMHIAEGYDPSRLHITGAPHLDHCFGPEYSRDDLLSGLGLDHARRTVVFGVGGSDATPELERVLTVLGRYADVQLIVKLHPECSPESRQLHQAAADRFGGGVPHRVIQFEHMLPVDLLKASEILISPYSNLVCEGLALGLDLILLCSPTAVEADPQGNITPIHNNADKFCRLAWNLDELEDKLMRALENTGEIAHSDDSDYHRRLLYHLVDGKASKRTVDVIDSILS